MPKKPCPPLPLVETHIRRFHTQGVSFEKMVTLLRKHYDTESYGLGKTKLKTYAKSLGLTSARSQGHTFDSIARPIADLRVMYPNAGAELLRTLLRNNFDIRVSREIIRQYLKLTEPEKVAARIGNGFNRRAFYAAGVNHFWAMDQHDKWKRFGLFLHGCIEAFTGKILWMVIWWTNSNPKFVCAQYVKAVRAVGGAPCVTQSDLGTENYNVAYAHTHIRHALDPMLAGSIQHNWKRGHMNIKPEQMWWRLRRTWTSGYEDLLDKGVQEQWYNNVNVADRLVFRWLAIPWLQKQLDSYVYNHNNSRRRASRRKILPSGIPDVMFENPESVNANDFKIVVRDTLIDAAENHWAAPTDPVFQLLPARCEQHIYSVYVQLGSPEVTFHSFWDVYNQVRDAVDSDLLFRASSGVVEEESTSEDSEPPLPHLKPCEFGKNGIPPMQYEEVPEYSARISEGAPGMVILELSFRVRVHTSADVFSEDDIMVEFSDLEEDELF